MLLSFSILPPFWWHWPTAYTVGVNGTSNKAYWGVELLFFVVVLLYLFIILFIILPILLLPYFSSTQFFTAFVWFLISNTCSFIAQPEAGTLGGTMFLAIFKNVFLQLNLFIHRSRCSLLSFSVKWSVESPYLSAFCLLSRCSYTHWEYYSGSVWITPDHLHVL